MNTIGDEALQLIESSDFKFFRSHEVPLLQSQRYTALCFLWQDVNGLAKVLQILSRSNFANSRRLEVLIGEWTVRGDTDLNYLGISLPSAGLDNLEHKVWRGVTSDLRLNLWTLYSDGDVSTQLMLYVTSTTKQDVLRRFHDCLCSGREAFSFVASDISLQLDAMQALQLGDAVQNRKLITALSSDSLDRLIGDDKMSMRSFLVEQQFTEKVRQCLIDKLVTGRRIKLVAHDRIPNMWGVDIRFFNNHLQNKQRHYYIYGPSNYGKSLFKSMLQYYFNTSVINPKSKTHKGVCSSTQIVIVDEFKTGNAFSLAQMNELGDNIFKFKVLYQDEYKVSGYIVIVFANDPLEVTMGKLSDHNREQLLNRFYEINLLAVEKFHNVSFHNGAHCKVPEEQLAKWACVDSDFNGASGMSLLNAYIKQKKIKLDFSLEASDLFDSAEDTKELKDIFAWKVPNGACFYPPKTVPDQFQAIDKQTKLKPYFIKPKSPNDEIVRTNNIQPLKFFANNASKISNVTSVNQSFDSAFSEFVLDKSDTILTESKLLGKKKSVEQKAKAECSKKINVDNPVQIRVPRQHKETVTKLVKQLKTNNLFIPESLLENGALQAAIDFYKQRDDKSTETEKRLDNEDF